jgi:hypothetical protein
LGKQPGLIANHRENDTNVVVQLQFEHPDEDAISAMRSMAESLTNNPASVSVVADNRPGWLVAEFTMPTEAQSRR